MIAALIGIIVGAIDSLFGEVPKKFRVPKALTYSTNQKKYLETFLEDGRIPISNNLCKANIKPFATARRAWLFTDTPKGVRANAVLYTIVETARANELEYTNI